MLNYKFIWEAPIPYPIDTGNLSEEELENVPVYTWNEESQEWKLVELTIE